MTLQKISGAAAVAVVLSLALVAGQDSTSKVPGASSSADTKPQAQESDPLKRPLSEAQKKQNAKALQKEVSKTYKKWLDEDVRWIITDEERAAFKQLWKDVDGLLAKMEGRP